MTTAYLNGRWLPDGEAVIPADDGGFLYGDAAFETGRHVPGGYFRLRSHLERLQVSASALQLPLPPLEELEAVARGLATRNVFSEATLRITVTRGGRAGPMLLGTLTPMPSDWFERAARGWSILTATVRHPPLECLPPVKTPGRLHGLLARAQARRGGADDGLLLTPEGNVSEGPSWNVFWRKGRELFTPAPPTGLLEGVTRSAIMELAPRLGLTLHEGLFPRSHLDDCEEAFATMTSNGVVPFSSLDGRELPAPAHFAATRLQEEYWRLVAAEAE